MSNEAKNITEVPMDDVRWFFFQFGRLETPKTIKL